MDVSSVFEAVMLVCFASGWPFSIAKTLRSRTVAGKSPMFMVVVEIGYVAGILCKLTGKMDPVIWLYVFNASLVAVDLALYLRFRSRSPSPSRAGAVAENNDSPDDHAS